MRWMHVFFFKMKISKKLVDDLTYQIIGCAIAVHREIGTGLLESVYQACLEREFQLNAINYKSEMPLPVEYKCIVSEGFFRLDFLVEDLIVVELKACDTIQPVYKSQLLTYMRLLQKPKGLLLNFNCTNMFKEGQQTLVNTHYSQLSPL